MLRFVPVSLIVAAALASHAAAKPHVHPIAPALAGAGIEVAGSVLDPRTGLPRRAVLQALQDWLSRGFGLPDVDEPPRVAFVSAERMLAIRYAGSMSAGAPDEPAASGAGVIAVYDTTRRIVYLPERWTGGTPAELSILVHEMVHHLQNVGRMRYPCAAAGEELAYAAQERWLAMFGADLAAEFGIDPLTRLVRTRCIH